MRSPATQGSVLRYRADRWSLALAGAVLAGQVGIFFGIENPWVAACAVIVLLPFQTVTIACAHNQHHKEVFRAAWLNRLYETVLFFETGLPPYLLTLHHNLGHHHRYLTPAEDTLRWRRRDGEPMRYAEYLLVNFLEVYPNTVALGRRHPQVFRKFLRFLAPCLAGLAALGVLDPARTVLVFVLPMALMILNTVRIGYQHHAGLDADDHLNASRNQGGRLYNRLTFNSGYHTAHHLKPGLHWSELPRFHDEIRERIPAALVKV